MFELAAPVPLNIVCFSLAGEIGGERNRELVMRLRNTDEKPRDFTLATGVRPLGLPIHELWLRITIDRNCTIVGAEASSDWAPYGGLCAESNTAYRKLIGLNLLLGLTGNLLDYTDEPEAAEYRQSTAQPEAKTA